MGFSRRRVAPPSRAGGAGAGATGRDRPRRGPQDPASGLRVPGDRPVPDERRDQGIDGDEHRAHRAGGQAVADVHDPDLDPEQEAQPDVGLPLAGRRSEADAGEVRPDRDAADAEAETQKGGPERGEGFESELDRDRVAAPHAVHHQGGGDRHPRNRHGIQRSVRREGGRV